MCMVAVTSLDAVVLRLIYRPAFMDDWWSQGVLPYIFTMGTYCVVLEELVPLKAGFHGPPRGPELGGPGACHARRACPRGTGGGPASDPALQLCRAGGFGGGPGPPKIRVMTKLVLDFYAHQIVWGRVLLVRGWSKFGTMSSLTGPIHRSLFLFFNQLIVGRALFASRSAPWKCPGPTLGLRLLLPVPSRNRRSRGPMETASHT